jgi:hypothetical protein
MTDSPIQPGDFSEELLSGYLDGELSSEEQALVESALNRDPQVQQLLEDLQQLRQCLQELPQEQPPEHAQQRVIEQVRSIPRVQEAPASDPVEGKNITRGSSSTRSMVPWLAAAAAAVALLFAVPPMLRDSSQVAQKSDAPSSLSAPGESAANEALPFDRPDEEALVMAADAIAGDTEEYFAESQIPVVYVTVPADAVDEIPAILAANSIREVDPLVLMQRMRAYKLADDPLRQELAANLTENDVSGTARSLARSIRSQTEPPAENSPVDIQQRRDQPRAQRATILLEGSPEKLELAWEQMSQYKNVHLVQQAGRQLQGLKYDANAFRGQVLAEEEALSEKGPGGGFGGKVAAAVAGGAGEKSAPDPVDKKELAPQPRPFPSSAVVKGIVDPAATRKRKDESRPIVIQLIIQVTE